MILATIVCDLCGCRKSWEHVGKTYVIRWAREKGWSVGIKIKCPECKAKKDKK